MWSQNLPQINPWIAVFAEMLGAYHKHHCLTKGSAAGDIQTQATISGH